MTGAGGAARLAAAAGYCWRNSEHPVVRAAHRWVDTAVHGQLRLTVSHASSGRLTVAYGGFAHGLTTLLPLLELHRVGVAGATSSRSTSRVAWSGLGGTASEAPADIVAIGCSPRQAGRLPGRAALVLPYRVQLVIETGGDAGAVHRRIGRGARKEFRHGLRVNSWSWEEDGSEAAFDYFYDRLHRPTMLRRHGERRRTEGRDVGYECLLRRGHLFFVTESGVRVAGALCRWESATRTLVLRLVGVLDGAQRHYTSGAFKAVYHFLVSWACENGVERLDLSGAEPLLSMGIVQWKHRFAPRMTLPPNHFQDKRVWFHVGRDTEEVRDFLVANPLIAMTPDQGLEALYFHDRKRQPRTGIRGDFDGIGASRCIDLDEFLAGLG